MSRTLKRRIYATEEKQAGYWRVVWSGSDRERAETHCHVHPDRRRVAVYDRNEEATGPRACLWVVEWRFSELFPWVEWGRYGTRRLADAEIRWRMPKGRDVRVLRFVRRKERKW